MSKKKKVKNVNPNRSGWQSICSYIKKHYVEAIGFVMGIAQSNKMLPNLILLYKEDTDHNKDKTDVDKFVGFNLRNLSQLRFKNYDQLVDGLLSRLEKHYEV